MTNPTRTPKTTSGSDKDGAQPDVDVFKRASIAEARDALASLVHDAEDGTPVEITRRGEPVAVLLSFHEYQRLLGAGPSLWDAICTYRSMSGLDDNNRVQHVELDFPRDRGTGRPAPNLD